MLQNNPGAAMLVWNMLDELAYELGYPNGGQDLVSEEPCTNIELMQIVEERLIAQAEFRRKAAMIIMREAEDEINRSYV